MSCKAMHAPFGHAHKTQTQSDTGPAAFDWLPEYEPYELSMEALETAPATLDYASLRTHMDRVCSFDTASPLKKVYLRTDESPYNVVKHRYLPSPSPSHMLVPPTTAFQSSFLEIDQTRRRRQASVSIQRDSSLKTLYLDVSLAVKRIRERALQPIPT